MRFMEYPAAAGAVTSTNFLIDGTNGTQRLGVSDLIYSMFDAAGIGGLMHRNIPRGKNLGTSFTASQLAAIQNGSFSDLWVGDYWVINGVTWRIVDVNYYALQGLSINPHLVIVPDSSLVSDRINQTATSNTGFVNSYMYTTVLPGILSTCSNAFGGHIINHQEVLTSGGSNGIATNRTTASVNLCLMSEIQLYGKTILGQMVNGDSFPFNHTRSVSQFKLFDLDPRNIWKGAPFWLRDMSRGTNGNFCEVGTDSITDAWGADGRNGVRPFFLVG